MMKGRKRFTLIELLVVVSIIAVLASLLLPALSRARGMARSIVCLGNMRQVGLQLATYVSDSDGNYPTVGSYLYAANYSAAGWPAHTNTWLPGPYDGPNWLEMLQEHSFTSQEAMRVILDCPAWEFDEPTYGYTKTNAGFAFGVNENVLQFWDFNGTGSIPGRPTIRSTSEGRVLLPAQTALLFDRMRIDRSDVGQFGTISIGAVGFHHPMGNGLLTSPWASGFVGTYQPQGRCNMVYTDGHGDAISGQNTAVFEATYKETEYNLYSD